MTTLGGREIHPVNVRVGGFYCVPRKKELLTFVEKLKWAKEAAIKTVQFVATLTFPDFEQDYEFVSLKHPNEYPLNEGHIVSSSGLDIEVSQYENYFTEEHIAYANALQSTMKDKGAYLVGPLARFNLNSDKLTPEAAEASRSIGLMPTCKNPFKSIIVRAVETVFACEEALRIIEQYEMPEKPYIEMTPRASVGYGCTEAPRGILYHRYRIDENGSVLDAKIVPPTAQNQKSIESDLREYVTKRIDTPIDKLTWECEQAVRNYDPCISCATHFLRIERD
jgi:coenzyme F420-reducing hydrogenase alpha subunit